MADANCNMTPGPLDLKEDLFGATNDSVITESTTPCPSMASVPNRNATIIPTVPKAIPLFSYSKYSF